MVWLSRAVVLPTSTRAPAGRLSIQLICSIEHLRTNRTPTRTPARTPAPAPAPNAIPAPMPEDSMVDPFRDDAASNTRRTPARRVSTGQPAVGTALRYDPQARSSSKRISDDPQLAQSPEPHWHPRQHLNCLQKAAWLNDQFAASQFPTSQFAASTSRRSGSSLGIRTGQAAATEVRTWSIRADFVPQSVASELEIQQESAFAPAKAT